MLKPLGGIGKVTIDLQTDLSKPGKGIWQRALDCKAQADIMSHHHFIDRFHLEPVV